MLQLWRGTHLPIWKCHDGKRTSMSWTWFCFTASITEFIHIVLQDKPTLLIYSLILRKEGRKPFLWELHHLCSLISQERTSSWRHSTKLIWYMAVKARCWRSKILGVVVCNFFHSPLMFKNIRKYVCMWCVMIKQHKATEFGWKNNNFPPIC